MPSTSRCTKQLPLSTSQSLSTSMGRLSFCDSRTGLQSQISGPLQIFAQDFLVWRSCVFFVCVLLFLFVFWVFDHKSLISSRLRALFFWHGVDMAQRKLLDSTSQTCSMSRLNSKTLKSRSYVVCFPVRPRQPHEFTNCDLGGKRDARDQTCCSHIHSTTRRALCQSLIKTSLSVRSWLPPLTRTPVSPGPVCQRH